MSFDEFYIIDQCPILFSIWSYRFADFLVDKFTTGSLDNFATIRFGVVREASAVCKSLDHGGDFYVLFL